MPFPVTSPTSGTDAQSLLINKAAAAGLAEPTGGLSTMDMLCAAVGNLLNDLPAAINVSLSTPILTSSSIKSSGTLGIGYATGAGGAVTQITSRATGVTLSKMSGTITTINTSLAALAVATFTVTNTLVAIGDVVVVSQQSGAVNTKTIVNVTAVAAGSFNISIYNADASTAETGTILINYVVFKAVSA